jgi:hypothetical protein
MVQSAFHGLDRASNEAPWDFDINSPLRLHNHGQMVIQKTMDRQIFYLNGAGERVYFSRLEFQERLSEFDDLVSFNIEDLDYLTGALDFRSLGLAVRFATLGRASARLPQGPEPVGMMMEFTANNLTRPVKGGWLVFDELIGRDVAIESFRLKEGGPEIWGYFNKNFNHYPNPSFVFGRLAEKGLFMPVAVADDKVYFQPCQGDLNFLVQTAFVARRSAKALNSLKTPADIPSALQAMSAQDEQPGFLTLFD